MNKHSFVIGHTIHIDIQFEGPYDTNLWSVRQQQLGPEYAAAVVGHGIDMRSSCEAAVRRLLTTPYSELRNDVEAEVQAWLRTHPMADIRQGDAHCRLYCILKIRR